MLALPRLVDASTWGADFVDAASVGFSAATVGSVFLVGDTYICTCNMVVGINDPALAVEFLRTTFIQHAISATDTRFTISPRVVQNLNCFTLDEIGKLAKSHPCYSVNCQERQELQRVWFLGVYGYVVQIETYSFSIYCSSNLMFDVWLVNQKVSFLWRCWCESYQSFIDHILSRKLFTNLYLKHQFLWAIVYLASTCTCRTRVPLLRKFRGESWRVSNWFRRCKRQGWWGWPPQGSAPNWKIKSDQNTGWWATSGGLVKKHDIPPIWTDMSHICQTWTGHWWYFNDHKSAVYCRVSSQGIDGWGPSSQLFNRRKLPKI